jgi:hypothetical protein
LTRISDIVVVEMSDATPEIPHTTLLMQAAALEALLATGHASFTEADLDDALSWLAAPARSEILHALCRNGWLEVDPEGAWTPSDAGHQVYDALRRTAAQGGLPYTGLPAGLTSEQIVRALLGRSLEELANAGREALFPILAAAPLLALRNVVQTAETYSLHRQPRPEVNR